MQLYVASNKISNIASLSHLTALTTLELGCNRIRSICNLEALTGLKELISRVEGLEGLGLLRDLWLNDNAIPAVDASLEQALQPVAASLTCLYLEGCPAAKDPEYKERLRKMLPALQQLDADMMVT
ncbi:predicted protein [Haematococcus lacustris]|uniref:Protein phosphatase 1 regulatory subunit 7 n=1 Tax=Haematococcus lacustris TaxID=44745 RepID=A0A699Z7P4_HAELA|nr:predicted protein [Haematococcus lacustris]